MAFKPGQGGRPRGATNKSNVEVRALAQQYTAQAIAVLNAIMSDRKAPHASRVMASNALLDRGHGKAPQALTGEGGTGPVTFTWAKA